MNAALYDNGLWCKESGVQFEWGTAKLQCPGLECWEVDFSMLYICCGGGLNQSLDVLVEKGGYSGVNMWKMREIVKYLRVHII